MICALLLLSFSIGTFQAETNEEIAYGLVHPLTSWDPIWTQVRINRFLCYHKIIFSLEKTPLKRNYRSQICHFSHIWKTFWETSGVTNKVKTPFNDLMVVAQNLYLSFVMSTLSQFFFAVEASIPIRNFLSSSFTRI